MPKEQYWQNAVKVLEDRIGEMEKKLDANSYGYGLILQEIRDTKEHIENKVNEVKKEIDSMRYRIK